MVKERMNFTEKERGSMVKGFVSCFFNNWLKRLHNFDEDDLPLWKEFVHTMIERYKDLYKSKLGRREIEVWSQNVENELDRIEKKKSKLKEDAFLSGMTLTNNKVMDEILLSDYRTWIRQKELADRERMRELKRLTKKERLRKKREQEREQMIKFWEEEEKMAIERKAKEDEWKKRNARK